jgi:hypothetical protein
VTFCDVSPSDITCIRHKLLTRRLWTLHLWVGAEFNTGPNYTRCLSLLWKETSSTCLRVERETLVPAYQTTRRHIPQHVLLIFTAMRISHLISDTEHVTRSGHTCYWSIVLIRLLFTVLQVVNNRSVFRLVIFFGSLQFCRYHICLWFVSNISLPFAADLQM